MEKIHVKNLVPFLVHNTPLLRLLDCVVQISRKCLYVSSSQYENNIVIVIFNIEKKIGHLLLSHRTKMTLTSIPK